MAGKTGTLDLQALLAGQVQSFADIDRDELVSVVNNELQAHSGMVRDQVGELAEPTTDRQRATGTTPQHTMYEVDERGRAPTQRELAVASLGFPLRRFMHALGWTQDFFEQKTPRDLALQVQAAELAHIRRVSYELKRALYNPTNYTFRDFLVDNVELFVKRLANADGFPIPVGPNGETVDAATHSHYNASATLTDAAAMANVDDVMEHGYGTGLRYYINRADEAAVRALASFRAYEDPRVTLSSNTTRIEAPRLDITRFDNRAIGVFGPAEVWVKPWAIPSYHVVASVTGEKPLVYRERIGGALQGLRIRGEIPLFPLLAQYSIAEFGFGVAQRVKAAILYIGGGAYVAPTLVQP